MTIQLATTTRNARLDAIETEIGTSAKLAIYSGSMPANCAADTTGTLLVEYDLAATWAAAASAGAKALSSLPLSTTAAAGAPPTPATSAYSPARRARRREREPPATCRVRLRLPAVAAT